MIKLPKFSQFKQIGKLLKKREKITLLVFFVLSIISFSFLAYNFYYNNTKEAPTFGGNFVEGMVGQPRFINPIYGETNDIDRTITGLVFSGLMTYDKNGKIINDLVSEYKISNDGKIYSFLLKDNILWHDGKKLTADDIVFTIKTIQNSDYKSPQRANWIDIEIEKTSEKSFDLKLKNSYNSFLENCTLKIIPKHIWENILPENFALSSYNLQPVGSGPYKFESLYQSKTGFIENINIEANRKYYDKIAFISKISFHFFEKEENLLSAAKQKTIDSFSINQSDNGKNIEEKINGKWTNQEKFNNYYFSLPRYFAVFFNSEGLTQKDKILSDINVRKALNYAIDKNEIIKQVQQITKNKISAVNSPILPEYFGYSSPEEKYDFSIENAKNLLEKSGFKETEGGFRQKAIKKTPAFSFKSYLTLKSKSTEVSELQKCLAKLGFSEDLKSEINGTFGKPTETALTNFQTKYLPEEKPTGETGAKTRKKLNELCLTQPEQSLSLKFTITTINQPQLVKTAQLLKDYWQKIGADIEIKPVEITDLKTIIKNRDYDALLYGQALGSEPDLYPFWHSSQTKDPGLNLSGYENKDADVLLKDARETLDLEKKQQDMEKLQNIILKDASAIFLYNPDYVYWANSKIKGIETSKIVDPAKKFSTITNWYIKTKRIFK